MVCPFELGSIILTSYFYLEYSYIEGKDLFEMYIT